MYIAKFIKRDLASFCGHNTPTILSYIHICLDERYPKSIYNSYNNITKNIFYKNTKM